MSWNPALTPGCPDEVGPDAIETLIIPRARDIGGFEVRRALPAPKRQMVGPFIFFDQMGPAEFLTGRGVDVRPHPHIGLGTVTYSPLARGVLTGKYVPGEAPGADTRAGRGDKRILETEWRPESVEIAQKVADHAQSRGLTPRLARSNWFCCSLFCCRDCRSTWRL